MIVRPSAAAGVSTTPSSQIERPEPTPQEMAQLLAEGVAQERERSLKMGIWWPIELDDGGTRYELPDGSIVDEYPWGEADEPPPGWWERFGIAPQDRPPKWRPKENV